MAQKVRAKSHCPINLLRRFAVLVPLLIVLVVASHLYLRQVASTYTIQLDARGATAGLETSLVVEGPQAVEAQLDTQANTITLVAKEPGTCYIDLVDAADLPADGSETDDEAIAGINMHAMWKVVVTDDLAVVVDDIEFSGWRVPAYALVGFLAVTVALCVWTFLELHFRAWYSYEMIASLGASIFLGATLLRLIISLLTTDNNQFHNFASGIVGLTNFAVWVSLPVMAVLAILVVRSNIILIQREGARPTNFLGIGVGLVWLLACIVWFFANDNYSGSFEEYRWHLVISGLLSTAIIFGTTLLVSTIICSVLAGMHKPSLPIDYAIILGCAIRKNGQPTPLLAGRIDAARQVDAEQQAQGFAPLVYVPSGGQGGDEPRSEASSMGDYLHAHGVPRERILLEDRATSTYENMAFSRDLILADWAAKGHSGQPRIAFATTNYHVFRSNIWAHTVGMQPDMMAAPTTNYFWGNAFLREFAGLVVARIVPIGIIFVTSALFFATVQYLLAW